MASTSTSHSIAIELRDIETSSVVTVPAFDSRTSMGRTDVFLNGIVAEERVYDVALSTQDSISADVIEISVNGGDPMRADVSLVAGFDDGDSSYRYSAVIQGRTNRATSNNSNKLFFQTYGFARMEIDIPGFGSYVTMDIPCVCIDSVNASDVRSMLEALLDNEDQTVADWMFASDDDAFDGFAILEGDARRGRSKSLISFIRLVQEVLDTYETWLSYFRSNGHCSIQSDSKRLSGFDVRQFGVDEFVWLMRNADVLSEVQADTGLSHNGHNYFPRYIDTEVKIKSYDNYENRVVLGFLGDVINSLKKAEASIREGVLEVQSRIARLDTLRGTQNLPALIVMEECASREVSFLDHIESQRMRAQRLFIGYKSALKDTREQSVIAQNIRRTKVFQEVRAYSMVYLQIERWRAFGEYSLARESLALHALRLDKLYEYYALYLILRAFLRNGYVLDDAYTEPCQRVQYSLDAPKFCNERMVNNLYFLKSGFSRVALYYEPVIYGDSREEHGITYHKKSPRLPFAPLVLDSYYLPDFLIRLTNENASNAFAIDAKYSSLRDLTRPRSHDGTKYWSRFNDAYFKYVTDTIDESLSSIDALWLLAGKEDIPGVKQYETASWISSREGYIPSGIVPASPTIDNLDELFMILDLALVEETVPQVSDDAAEDANADDVIEDLKTSDEADGDGHEASLEMRIEQPDASETQPIPVAHTEKQTGLGTRKTGIINLIERLLTVHPSHKDLRMQRWCVKSFGVNSPVIRDKKPTKRFEARKYSRQSLSVGDVYVLVDWRQDQLNMLTRFLAQREKGNSEQTSS